MKIDLDKLAPDDNLYNVLWNGEPYETGPLSRQKDLPLIACLLAEYGSGLGTRFMARLSELSRLPGDILRALDDIPPGNDIIEKKREGIDVGLAQVETARGQLAHMVELKDELVHGYRIFAPTDWNFHNGGPAARALLMLGEGDVHELKRRATLLINAIDPCVGFSVRVL